MSAATALLARITGSSSPYGPLLFPIEGLFTAFARSFWARGIQIEPRPRTSDSCLVVASDQVSAYCLTGSEGWANYEEILAAFEARNRPRREGVVSGGSKSGPLPLELVTSPNRLILRDRDDPLESLVSTEPVYPRRAWVGALHPSVGAEMAYVLSGMLNSTLGLVLYRRLAHSEARSGHDLRKGVLLRLKIPVLNYDVEAFQRAALLSYRLHCLCAASRQFAVPASVQDEDIPNHRMQLLSELVRLYGFDDHEARQLVEDVLPAGAADVPGAERSLFYRPKQSMTPVRLHTSEMIETYESLKEQARGELLSADDHQKLEDLRAILQWEHRANSPVPAAVLPRQPEGAATADDAMRLADRYLSENLGQTLLAESARRISSRLWEVQLNRSAPPRRLPPSCVAPVGPSREQSSPGRVWVNALTGMVSDDPAEACDAAAPRA